MALVILPITSLAFSVDQVEDQNVYNTVSLSPGSHEISISPGESVTQIVRIINRLGHPANFLVNIEDFTSGNTNDEVIHFLGDDQSPYSLRDYVSAEVDDFSLEHGEVAEVLVTVSLPENILPGGRYAAVFFSFGDAPEKEGVIVNARSRVGSLFFIRVNGPVFESGELVSLSTSKDNNIFIGKRPTFLLSYKNDGNVYLNPYGGVEVYNFLGKKTSEEAIDPYFILPNASRISEEGYSSLIWPGKNTAIVRLNKGYDDIIDIKEISFWYFSYLHMAVIFLLIILIFYVLKLLLRKKR